MSDLATMLKQQMENNIASQLDAAVLSGDAQTARKIAKQYADLQVASVPKGPAAKVVPTKEDCIKAVSAKAPWFGVDPRKSAKAAEIGKMMLPERFDTAEAFADALLAEVEKDEKKPDAENENEEVEEEEVEEEPKPRAARRNGTAAPELNTGNRATAGSSMRQAFETGDIKHLPKAAADDIKKLADKFARNGTKEQKAAYISSAVKAKARGELIATGKYNAKDNKFT